MTRTSWWQVLVTAPAGVADAVASVMEETFGTAPVQYQRIGSPTARITVYLQSSGRPAGDKICLLRSRISRLASRNLDRRPCRLRVSPLSNKDWRQSWKKHFRPIEIGGALLIKPTWSRRRAKPGQSVVLLDPGLAFGTGHHPTTAYCLGEIVRLQNEVMRPSFTDVGTGSGILAIAAAKRGYKPILAIDIDPESVRSALANARRNKVQRLIEFRAVGLGDLDLCSCPKHDLVCANLSDELLVKERARLANLVAQCGRLVLAGILRKDFARVRSAYEELSFRMERSRAEGEWRSGTFVRNAPLP